jgi:hypothetical protein
VYNVQNRPLLGHGDPESGALLVSEKNSEYLYGIDFDKLLKDFIEKFADDAKIELKSCGSANPLSPYNPAKAFKTNLPFAHIFGYTGLLFDLGPIEFGAPNMKPFTGVNPLRTPGKGSLKNVPKSSHYIEVKL